MRYLGQKERRRVNIGKIFAWLDGTGVLAYYVGITSLCPHWRSLIFAIKKPTSTLKLLAFYHFQLLEYLVKSWQKESKCHLRQEPLIILAKHPLRDNSVYRQAVESDRRSGSIDADSATPLPPE